MALHEQCVGATDEWYTPKHVFDALGCRFDMDVAAPFKRDFVSTPTSRFLIAGSLDWDWEGFVWMNPPFGARNGLVPWLQKFWDHANGIALVPDRTSAPWWQTYVPQADAILFVAKKIKFIGADGVEESSMTEQKATVGVAQGAREPVAYRHRFQEWQDWSYSSTDPHDAEQIVEPLYLAAQPPAAPAEPLAAALHLLNDLGERALLYAQSAPAAPVEMFKCNCPHEVRSGCSEPECPHYVSRSSAETGEVPTGWKLVPERPTDVMMDAGLYQSSHDATFADVFSAYIDMVRAAPDGPDDTSPHDWKRSRDLPSAPQTLWQPIETAPKDGTPIDLWAGDSRIADAYWGRPEHDCGEAGSYCDCCPSYDGWCDVFGYLTGPDGSSGSEPTHWTPRPTSPLSRPHPQSDNSGEEK